MWPGLHVFEIRSPTGEGGPPSSACVEEHNIMIGIPKRALHLVPIGDNRRGKPEPWPTSQELLLITHEVKPAFTTICASFLPPMK